MHEEISLFMGVLVFLSFFFSVLGWMWLFSSINYDLDQFSCIEYKSEKRKQFTHSQHKALPTDCCRRFFVFCFFFIMPPKV